MQSVSADFKTAVRDSHTAITAAEIRRGDNLLLELEPLDGSIEDDSRRSVRRTCSVTLFSDFPRIGTTPVYATYFDLATSHANYTALAAPGSSYGSLLTVVAETETILDNGIVPDDAFDALTPFGNELHLFRGIRVTSQQLRSYATLSGDYDNYSALAGVATYGTLTLATVEVVQDELVPLGVFVITNVDMQQAQGGVNISVTGQDRSLKVSRNRWTEPYVVAKGTNVVTAITKLLQDRWDDIPISFASSTDTVNRMVFGLETENDPWADAQKLANSCGLDLYFDGSGTARLEPTRVYDDTTADDTYTEDADAVVLDITRNLSVEQTYNGVIVTGESTSEDVIYRGEVWDEDPASPTYRYGPFGQVPKFLSLPAISSEAIALKTASAALAKSKGAQEAIEWTQLTDPSIEAGDVIALKNTGTKVDRLLVIDRLQIPLRASEAMKATARTIRTLGAEEA
jgi:hypothetical protein